MSIKITNDNCSYKKCYAIKEIATAEIVIGLEFEKIVSVQSQRQRKEELTSLIQAELSKYKWLICGSVTIEMAWYLNAPERQETDKVGDIDNISKPIIDALTGENGILIDDAQIGSIHSFWMSRNTQVQDNILRIKISFNNDECINKDQLIFVQYSNAVCIPLRVDFNDIKSMTSALIIIHSRLKTREFSQKIRELGGNVDDYLVCSSWDVHRTRLGGFSQGMIYQLPKFKEKLLENGLTYGVLLKAMRNVRT